MKITRKIKNKIDMFVFYPVVQLALQGIKYLSLLLVFPLILITFIFTSKKREQIRDFLSFVKLRKIDF